MFRAPIFPFSHTRARPAPRRPRLPRVGLALLTVGLTAAEPGVLRHETTQGWISHWLVAGPEAIRLGDLTGLQGANDDETKKRILARHLPAAPDPTAVSPAEGATAPLPAGGATPWRVYRTAEDHTIAFPEGGNVVLLHALAAARVRTPHAFSGEWTLAAHGPVQVWLNGRSVFRADTTGLFVPVRHRFPAELRAGDNDILIRGAVVKLRVGVFGLALRLPADAPPCAVLLPTTLPEPAARQQAERAAQAAFLDREVFEAPSPLRLHWAGGDWAPTVLRARVENRAGAILAARSFEARPGFVLEFSASPSWPPGRHTVILDSPAVADARVRELAAARLPFTLRTGPPDFSERPHGTVASRRRELLERAATQEGFYAELAKMAVGRWTELDRDVLRRTVDKIRRRADTADFEAPGVAAALLRFGRDPAFPVDLRADFEAALLGFRYWSTEPGTDAMWFWSENHQIAFHTAEILAGQLFPERVFSNHGRTGAWHRAHGESLARTWLRKRLAGGFHEWHSNVYYAVDFTALAFLTEHAAAPDLRALAATALSRLCFDLAVNSHRGTFGTPHARTYPGNVKDGRADGTAGVSLLLWGIGALGDLKATVPLALAESYALPPVIAAIATTPPPEIWSRQRQAGELDPAVDHFSGRWEANTVTYRTPDTMLASAQAYRPGQRGNMQHIWQATLAPDAVAFVNHPPFLAETGSPNFWVGNLVLPRVAQWKDALVDLRRAEPGTGLGFTHAFVPLHAFDEWHLEGRWLTARKGDAYLALASAAGPQLVRSGRYALRELRSHAARDAWLCQLGSARQDGSYAEFQRQVRALPFAFEERAVRVTWRTLRGDELSFAWEEPFLRNGTAVPLDGFPSYDNPFCQEPFPARRLRLAHAGLAAELSWPETASAAAAYRWERDDSSFLALHGPAGLVWRLNFSPELVVPHFHPLNTADGRLLTWVAPEDHPWHFGLWHSWKLINGVNDWDWASNRAAGRPEGTTRLRQATVLRADATGAAVRLELQYHPAAHPGQVEMADTIDLTIEVPRSDGSYRIDWHQHTRALRPVVLDRTPLPDEPGGRSFGGYGGLTWRGSRLLTAGACTNSDGLTDAALHRRPARWTSFAGLLEGRAVGVTLFDHPDNPRFPAPWFLEHRTYAHGPNWFLNAAFLHDRPLPLQPGGTLTRRYRIRIDPQSVSTEQLRQEFAEFSRLPPRMPAR